MRTFHIEQRVTEVSKTDLKFLKWPVSGICPEQLFCLLHEVNEAAQKRLSLVRYIPSIPDQQSSHKLTSCPPICAELVRERNSDADLIASFDDKLQLRRAYRNAVKAVDLLACQIGVRPTYISSVKQGFRPFLVFYGI